MNFEGKWDNQLSAEMRESVIESYFYQIHPWIPMVHEAKFRDGLSNHAERQKLEVIIQAMVVAALKFVDIGTTFQLEDLLQVTKASRDWVVLNAMDNLCVESLQALTIIAFDDVSLYLCK
jgi:hypothetical protein